MLVRVIINNFLSFGEETEFNMLPYTRIQQHKHHRNVINNIDLLRMASLYGANGAGKSNFVKVLQFIKEIVLDGNITNFNIPSKFKMNPEFLEKGQVFEIEFIKRGIIYYYTLEIDNKIVKKEELYKISSKNKIEELIFYREPAENDKIKVEFFDGFEKDEENKYLKNLIENNLTKPYQLLLTNLNNLEKESFVDASNAYNWFKEDLIIIFPDSKPQNIVVSFDKSSNFRDFANDIFKSFDTGVVNIQTRIIRPDFDMENYEKIVEAFERKRRESNQTMIVLRNDTTGEFIFGYKENGNYVFKELVFRHESLDNEPLEFNYIEESDGTKRLLDFIPMLQGIINEKKVFVIDEIERSIHPMLIRQIINKFSKEESTKGQLIYTTHESNLLDQKILRQDEIWFAEKDKTGNSRIYPLSDFKVHNTKDIKSGYFNGRYGAIPFLGNLKNLQWKT